MSVGTNIGSSRQRAGRAARAVTWVFVLVVRIEREFNSFMDNPGTRI